MSVDVRGLKITIGGKPIVSDADMTIADGERVGLIGSSGSGKSMIAKAMLGLLPLTAVTNGSIDMGSTEIIGASERALADLRGRYVGAVFQNPAASLNPVMTVGAQIMEVLKIHHPEQSTAQLEARVDEMMELVGIPAKRKVEYPHQFSGGMKQRIVIAIALACEPKLILADEPTTALDVTIQAKILELIRSIQRERGISVIYITHDLGVVAKVADYVDVMYAGKIVETGTIDEIFYEPRHPYTWGLLSAMPDLDTADDRLYTIPGSPPNLLHEKQGDAFAPRNHFALNIDDEVDPPMFKISDTHYAATWLLDPRAPKVDMPPELAQRIARMRAEAEKIKEAE